MPRSGSSRPHVHLVGCMAQTLGLDLDRESETARLNPAAYDRALRRCADCPDPEGCAVWLEQRSGGAEHAPEMCQNKLLLENLRRYR